MALCHVNITDTHVYYMPTAHVMCTFIVVIVSLLFKHKQGCWAQRWATSSAGMLAKRFIQIRFYLRRPFVEWGVEWVGVAGGDLQSHAYCSCLDSFAGPVLAACIHWEPLLYATFAFTLSHDFSLSACIHTYDYAHAFITIVSAVLSVADLAGCSYGMCTCSIHLNRYLSVGQVGME